jgi:predicted RNA binding protein YcfA (HicA-like mRNA interferase family)
MSRLPSISGRDCVKALDISLVREDPFAQVVVPDHRELDRGTLRAIIRQAGLSVDEFLILLN